MPVNKFRCGFFAGSAFTIDQHRLTGGGKPAQQAPGAADGFRRAFQHNVLVAEVSCAVVGLVQPAHTPHMAQAVVQARPVGGQGVVVLAIIPDQPLYLGLLLLGGLNQRQPAAYRQQLQPVPHTLCLFR